MSSVLIAWMLAGLAVLIAVYMTYPRLKRRTLSAARFFKDLPPPRRDQSRLRWGKIQFTASFFMQLAVLLLLLAALLWPYETLETGAAKGFGLWFLVDTSAGMSTKQRGKTRLDAAVRELGRLIDRAEENAGEMDFCVRLSSIDMEIQDWLSSGSGSAARQAASRLKPRALGTDLRIIRRQLSLLAEQTRSGSAAGPEPRNRCAVTHVVVISDLPAPSWLPSGGDMPVTWRDISEKADNVGFTAIQAVRNPLTGKINEVKLTVTAYGKPPTDARLHVTGPEGSPVLEEALQWGRNNAWYGGFVPPGSGVYRLRLSPGGAYSFDDSAVIEVAAEHRIRVDWQLPGNRFPLRMGWVIDRDNPHLRVVSYKSAVTAGGVPTMIIGKGYAGSKKKAILRDFVETSPLIEDVNFDALETLGLVGVELPPGFEPVLRGLDSGAWAAHAPYARGGDEPLRGRGASKITKSFDQTFPTPRRGEPIRGASRDKSVSLNKSFDQTFPTPRRGEPIRGASRDKSVSLNKSFDQTFSKVWPPAGSPKAKKSSSFLVPGLPTGTNDVKGRVSAALFFNALRVLLQEREFPPLYTLTSPYLPEPEGNRLALHEDEGNTFHVPHSQGGLDEIKPLLGRRIERPLWPFLLLAAALMFLVERVYAVFRRGA
ncbi:MAG: BatA and WFA domain-containing protein [Candidatus Aminicenantes bacterium]|nr:BatA and WFA domain-containing protein [Candidatus Aminicenantes bacterium]